MYPYEYMPPPAYGGRPYGRYGGGRGDYYAYDLYQGNRNYSRGGGGRPYRANRY